MRGLNGAVRNGGDDPSVSRRRALQDEIEAEYARSLPGMRASHARILQSGSGSAILLKMCIDRGFALDRVRRHARDRLTAAFRQEAMWSLHKTHGLNLSQVGRIMERDHATVIYGVRRHQERIDDASSRLRSNANEFRLSAVA